jgi:hypothetical protein
MIIIYYVWHQLSQRNIASPNDWICNSFSFLIQSSPYWANYLITKVISDHICHLMIADCMLQLLNSRKHKNHTDGQTDRQQRSDLYMSPLLSRRRHKNQINLNQSWKWEFFSFNVAMFKSKFKKHIHYLICFIEI